MTLLLNLINPQGIHQSSDYRLTSLSGGRTVEDEFGSKQIRYDTLGWGAKLSFTGIASIGARKTRDWILEALAESAGTADAAAVLHQLAVRASSEIRRVPPKHRYLTIVAVVHQTELRPKVFVISCMDRPRMPPLVKPLDHFEVYEVPTNISCELIFGCTKAVSRADRNLLKRINTSHAAPTEIRRALARVNTRAAKLSRGAISRGCFVSSTMLDGIGVFENFGLAPSVPLDVGRVLGDPKGKTLAIVQGVEGRSEDGSKLTIPPMKLTAGNKLLVKILSESPILFVSDSSGSVFRRAQKPLDLQVTDEDADWKKFEAELSAGRAQSITFSSTYGSFIFTGPNRSEYGTIEVLGASGEIVVVKNRVAKITIATVRVHAFQSFQHEVKAVRTTWEIPSQLIINGVQRDWGYAVDMVLDASGGAISLLQNAVGLRSSGPIPMSCLEAGEELTIVSSISPSVMNISKDRPDTFGTIVARLFLRDISQLPDVHRSGPATS